MSQTPLRVLFVCLGNICRSPAAEAVFRHRVGSHGLGQVVEADSAGTGSWHVGEGPHELSIEVGQVRGYRLDHVVRQVQADDFDRFDLIVPMDRSNRSDLHTMAPRRELRASLVLLRSFDPEGGADHEVPDPWGKPRSAFESMYDLIERSCDGLVEHVRLQLGR